MSQSATLGASLALLCCVWVSPVSAQQGVTHLKTESNGVAITVGSGARYVGMLGFQVAYYIQVPRSLFRLAPYLGAGAGLCVSVEDQTECTSGATLGILGSWGHKHRGTLALSYGTVGARAPNLHGTLLDPESVEGISIALGYEYMAFSGFVLRMDAGVAYSFLPPLLRNDNPLALTVTMVGVGYKFR